MNDVVRLRAKVAYDGSKFHGFAEQPNQDVPTVSGALRTALERVFGELGEFVCAGRTDTGVHGHGQVVHVDVNGERFARYGLGRAQRALNKQLSPTIVLRELDVAPVGFHARFSATARRYRYTVLNAEVADPLRAHQSWWVADPLDIAAMNEAAGFIVGEHDFSTFCRRPKTEEPVSLVRRVHSATWERDDDVVVLSIEANAFCHQMVRALTGMFVEIGRGRRAVADMASALAALDRASGAPLAPPQGLVLYEVLYDEQ